MDYKLHGPLKEDFNGVILWKFKNQKNSRSGCSQETINWARGIFFEETKISISQMFTITWFTETQSSNNRNYRSKRRAFVS